MPEHGDKEPAVRERAMTGDMGTVCESRQASRDHSQERQDAMDKTITDTLVRNTIKLTANFMAFLNESLAVSMPTALKTSSGAAGITVMLNGPKT